MSSNNNQNINFDINNDVIVFNTFNTKKMLSTSLNNNHNDIINGYTLTSKDIIRQINPVVIPRISTIANMAFCERATYNVSFFGMESENFSANGVIGSSIHRIVLRSLMEILESIKKNNITTSPSVSKKTKAKETFILNAERDIKINWKHFMISNIENPLPYILEDLEKRVDRLIDQIFDEEEEHKEILFRPEFTIRNIKIPLEGRLDLVKIKLTKKEKEKRIKQNQYFNCYTSTDELVNLEKESVEIIQIKTGNYQPRTAVWNLQADAEALLLMKTLNLKEPPKYTWQFSDKDGKRKKFNFEKVIKSIEKYIQIWNSKTSPQITGFCPKCSLRDGCLNWTFVNHNTLSRSKRIKRNIEFHLSKKIRDEISLEDRWKVYVVLQSPEQRQKEGSAITNLIIDPSSINW